MKRSQPQPDQSWARALKLLQAFVAREGHDKIRGRRIERGFRLGAWVSRQRLERRPRS